LSWATSFRVFLRVFLRVSFREKVVKEEEFDQVLKEVDENHPFRAYLMKYQYSNMEKKSALFREGL
jgi:hypothetical protein